MVSSGALAGTASRSWASTVATRPSKGARTVSSPTRRSRSATTSRWRSTCRRRSCDLEVARLAAEPAPLVRLLELDLGDAHGVAAALVVDLVEQPVGAQLLGPLEVAAGGLEADPPELDGLLVPLVLLAGGEAARGRGRTRSTAGAPDSWASCDLRSGLSIVASTAPALTASPALTVSATIPCAGLYSRGWLAATTCPCAETSRWRSPRTTVRDLHPVEVDRLLGPRPALERRGEGQRRPPPSPAATPSPIFKRRESPGALATVWSMESVSVIMPALKSNRCASAAGDDKPLFSWTYRIGRASAQAAARQVSGGWADRCPEGGWPRTDRDEHGPSRTGTRRLQSCLGAVPVRPCQVLDRPWSAASRQKKGAYVGSNRRTPREEAPFG